jgi:hypothetical protein
MHLRSTLVTALGIGAFTAAALVAQSGAVSLGPVAQASTTTPAQTMGGDCTWPFCGVVYNRSGHAILVMHNASGPNDSDCDGQDVKILPDGKASDKYLGWKDSDCWTEDVGTPWHRFTDHPLWVY